jgi:WD40 repeat protein
MEALAPHIKIAMTVRTLPIFAFLSLAAVLEAQSQSTINAPVAGYVFDKVSQGLRPIQGIPGASLLGAPLSFGYKISEAYVSPSLDSAFAVAADGGSHFFQIQNGSLSEVSIDGLANAGFSHIVAFSPSGKALAVYAGHAVQFLTGLSGTPKIAGSVDLTNVARPETIALSDDGAALLVAGGGTLRLFGSYADMGTIMNTAPRPAIAFAAGGHDAAIADTTAGIVLYRDLMGSGGSQVIAPPDQSGAPTSALAFSSDEKAIYLASASNQTVTRFDLVAGSSDRLPCSCSPTSLARMGNVFRLTELAKDPLWLLDQPEGDARVVFVPALVQTAAQ